MTFRIDFVLLELKWFSKISGNRLPDTRQWCQFCCANSLNSFDTSKNGAILFKILEKDSIIFRRIEQGMTLYVQTRQISLLT